MEICLCSVISHRDKKESEDRWRNRGGKGRRERGKWLITDWGRHLLGGRRSLLRILLCVQNAASDQKLLTVKNRYKALDAQQELSCRSLPWLAVEWLRRQETVITATHPVTIKTDI